MKYILLATLVCGSVCASDNKTPNVVRVAKLVNGVAPVLTPIVQSPSSVVIQPILFPLLTVGFITYNAYKNAKGPQ